jgi:hypothetical protein
VCWAVELARRAGQPIVSADILLLSLVETGQPLANEFLHYAGINVSQIRNGISSLLLVPEESFLPRETEAVLLLPINQLLPSLGKKKGSG